MARSRLLVPAFPLMFAFSLALPESRVATGQETMHDDAGPNIFGFAKVELPPSHFSFGLQRTVFSETPGQAKEKTPALNRVTVEQLESFLKTAHTMRQAEVARHLAGYQLTERFSSVKLAQWLAVLHDQRSRRALMAVVDASVFLETPAAEVVARPPPDTESQRVLLSKTMEDLDKTFAKLPDFFATRSTTRFQEALPTEMSVGQTAIDDRPFEEVGNSAAIVFYRGGHEVTNPTAPNDANGEEKGLKTEGTFGPILSTIFFDAISSDSVLAWSYWEQSPAGPLAIFRYEVPEQASHYDVSYCCIPEGGKLNVFHKRPGYHGEIAIDPENGAVLRLTMEAVLGPSLPLIRSDIMVEYAPTDIGGRMYFCPRRSVSTSTGFSLSEFGGKGSLRFRTFGPYVTLLNDVAFDQYHVFRSESRILSGDTPIPEQR